MVSGARPRVAAVEDGLKSWVPHWLPKVRPKCACRVGVCARSSGAHTSPRRALEGVWTCKRCVAVLSTLRVLTAALSRVEEGDPKPLALKGKESLKILESPDARSASLQPVLRVDFLQEPGAPTRWPAGDHLSYK